MMKPYYLILYAAKTQLLSLKNTIKSVHTTLPNKDNAEPYPPTQELTSLETTMKSDLEVVKKYILDW